jgi:hypothetical protein
MAYAKAWDRRHRQPGQRGGALGRAALDVLSALLWAFHNARSGCCFPSYERIAERAGCARSTVAEAIKALEWAGVLTWQNRIVRVRERCCDLWGKAGWQWRVVRTSNAYVFRDPAQEQLCGVPVTKSDQRTGTQNQEIKTLPVATLPDTGTPGTSQTRRESALERALARLGTLLAATEGIEQGAGG